MLLKTEYLIRPDLTGKHNYFGRLGLHTKSYKRVSMKVKHNKQIRLYFNLDVPAAWTRQISYSYKFVTNSPKHNIAMRLVIPT